MWPTATATDANASGSRMAPGSKAHTGTSLTDAAVHGHATGRRDQGNPSSTGRSRARLNYKWVSQLMNFPPDWLDLPLDTDEQP